MIGATGEGGTMATLVLLGLFELGVVLVFTTLLFPLLFSSCFGFLGDFKSEVMKSSAFA